MLAHCPNVPITPHLRKRALYAINSLLGAKPTVILYIAPSNYSLKNLLIKQSDLQRVQNKQPHDRRASLIGTGIINTTLELGAENPNALFTKNTRLSYQKRKPIVQNSPLQCSISHDKLTVVAAISSIEIGVDCEPLGRQISAALRDRLSEIRAYSGRSQYEALKHWTIFESILKLSGPVAPASLNDVKPVAGTSKWQTPDEVQYSVSHLDYLNQSMITTAFISNTHPKIVPIAI